MRLQTVVYMRHLVLVVVGMRYLGVDRLVRPMGSHLLVDQSADMLDHRTRDERTVKFPCSSSVLVLGIFFFCVLFCSVF